MHSRLVAHAQRHAATPFPVLDVTDIVWLFTREDLLAHLQAFPDSTRHTQTISQLQLLRARVGTRLVVGWPAEAPRGWLLARNAQTGMPVWLGVPPSAPGP